MPAHQLEGELVKCICVSNKSCVKTEAQHNFPRETRAPSCPASEIPNAFVQGKFWEAGVAAMSMCKDARKGVSLPQRDLI